MKHEHMPTETHNPLLLACYKSATEMLFLDERFHGQAHLVVCAQWVIDVAANPQ